MLNSPQQKWHIGIIYLISYHYSFVVFKKNNIACRMAEVIVQSQISHTFDVYREGFAYGIGFSLKNITYSLISGVLLVSQLGDFTPLLGDLAMSLRKRSLHLVSVS